MSKRLARSDVRNLVHYSALTFLLISGRYDQVQRDVILKAASPDHFENEVRTLGLLQGHGSFRQLVDVIEGQSIMVLEHLVSNIQHLVNMRPKRKLEELEVKIVAKVMLEGLDRMHELNLAHTGMS